MNLKLVSIELECKSGIVVYQLNEQITAFYGNIGVGKTSLMNLISFCLGNDLVHTLAIDEEVHSCKLSVFYNDSPMTFARRISSNNIIIKSDKKEILLKAKDTYSNDISDFFSNKKELSNYIGCLKRMCQAKRRLKYPLRTSIGSRI